MYLPGNRVHLHGPDGPNGTVLGPHSEDYLPTWATIKDDTNAIITLDRTSILELIVPKDDPLE